MIAKLYSNYVNLINNGSRHEPIETSTMIKFAKKSASMALQFRHAPSVELRIENYASHYGQHVSYSVGYSRAIYIRTILE